MPNVLRRLCLFTLFLLFSSAGLATAQDTPTFEFREGDRVILLGNTLIEREQLYGDWEQLLTLANAGKHVTFRNLGWSADTVWAESRGIFDAPEKGYERMIAQIKELNPTVVIFGYGGVEAFDGSARQEAFLTQFRKLIGDIRTPECRFVFLTPAVIRGYAVPVRRDLNVGEHLEQYEGTRAAVCGLLQTLATETGGIYIDIAPVFADFPTQRLTDNGLHLNAAGYQATGRIITAALSPQVKLDEIDLTSELAQNLRTDIRKKNELYFHRWRPQNFTYLFGFRQHEQGNNAVEIPQFDPLVAEIETRIFDLAKTIRGVE